ncbi:MAG: antibiotic ABC transporter ATP-binding protein [Ignavibacteria bacterium RIFOXYB2_FULL_35_12]|nr:MAG: antibiotic ABC transporter ATP-binding protein [Ignavibacteria bacterium GWA2_36_19]OGU52450.1 MAG: antibiotic ABC transporter ATP-binding protein [Ignavibacteria bacterium GWC2_35_8]OGU63052.1 MAG: antibiotic ABC transporter ATP-binding protein [Ignavibacteria bacterium GWF2_35_20]OGU83053.1 MAG: antibiotic ABC transporter ATP-binding protein [Ignavibacteria bacterium RBG_16_35_7]OGU87037.1 MAG: antibiotic ABC transporter ATP-binding protein [Ignavibacteria bacterium RIFOXYC12_FULL_35_
MSQDYKSEDEILGKAYDARLMKRLLKYVKPYKKYVLFAILLNMVVAVLGPIRPYLTKIAVDDHITNSNYNGLLAISLLLLGSLALQAVIQYFLTYYTQYLGQKTIFDLRMQIFRHVQNLALKFFDKTPIGRLVTRTTNDVESLNELFSSGIVMVFSDVFIIIWILVFMFFMDIPLTLVTLSVLPVLIYGTFLFRKKVRDSYRDVRFHLARLNSYMQEHITGMNIVQIFSKQKDELNRFSKINNDYRDANIKSILYYAVFYPTVEFLSSIAIGLIIWYGGGEIMQKTLTIGVLFAFIQYTEMFFRPIRDLSEKYNIMQTAMASSERIFKLLDNETFIANPANPKNLTEVKGEIEFKNVWFAYNENNYILKDVSFKINPGETVAIVGATGAGKTSIINILSRFYDINKGSILIDGIDIREVDKRELRKHISMVLQDVFLFSGTIESNISMSNDSIPLEKIMEAAITVGADKFIDSLPKKYNEIVKERGATLSVGQKQLVSFARALAYNPQILILDEATSSVDTETEILIQEAIHKLLVGRTAIVIAHRLSTIQNADNIIVLHKGEIRETGTHQELLAKRGIYYKLYQLQFKDQEISKAV